jgi:integrase
MSKRRGRGEGSIYRRKDGLWVGQYTIQTIEGNKTRYIYSKTRKDAATKLAKAIADRDAGFVFDAGSLNLGQYLDKWLDAVKDTVKQRTWQRHEEISRIHLKPALGDVRLARLNALQVQSLYRAKLDSGLSPRTVQIIHTTLYKGLKQAVKWSLVPRNVADAVNPPRPPKSEINPLTVNQVKALLRAAEGNKLETLYVLAVTTGMRQGELLGLQWRDVDLHSGTIQVRRTIFSGVISAPKTARSRRSIRLTRVAMRALQQHHEKQEQESEWVFCSSVGTSISAHNLHNRSWKPLLKAAGLPASTRFHDLRHSCATLLLMKNVNPRLVADLLGHSDVAFTLMVYSHVLENMQGTTAAAMEDALS